jgi:2-polyprenyl-3-methyl-5-hydroxy-6-metoxy-1,4-benzoquinol methylase
VTGLKSFDYWLQTARIDAAAPFVPDGARVLDIGAADGVLFRRLGDRIAGGVGIDPDTTASVSGDVRLVPGKFPDDIDSGETFGVVTALAVFEHLGDDERDSFAAACFAHVQPGGRCILTIPSPLVDPILKALVGMRVIDGMHEGDHHGFEPDEAIEIFRCVGFSLERARRFQIGLNNLFVFSRPNDEAA